MLFKALTNKALVDFRTTTAMSRTNLASLDVNIEVVRSDMKALSHYVLFNCQAFKNCGYDIDEDDMQEHLLGAIFWLKTMKFMHILCNLRPVLMMTA